MIWKLSTKEKSYQFIEKQMFWQNPSVKKRYQTHNKVLENVAILFQSISVIARHSIVCMHLCQRVYQNSIDFFVYEFLIQRSLQPQTNKIQHFNSQFQYGSLIFGVIQLKHVAFYSFNGKIGPILCALFFQLEFGIVSLDSHKCFII